MAFRGRGRARGSYRSDSYAASSAQFNYPPPPEHNITRHPSCNIADIPEDWLNKLKNSWNVFKAGDHVNRIICVYLSNCENPYASALQIMAESNDFYHSKTKSMASFVMESFAAWVAPQENNWRHCLTPQLKMEAFNLVTQQKNIALTRLVFQTFHLVDNPTDYLEKLQFMAKCKLYKEACQCASLLHLNGFFTFEDLVLPLVLQDKHPVAEEALVQVPDMQKELVVMLDALLGGKNLTAQVDDLILKLDVPDVKYEVFYNPKSLGKLVARLLKKFELPQDLAPNLNKKRTGGALQFLIRKRYKDNLNSESWNEMVIEAVGDDPHLQLELVLTIANNYNDSHEALYWAHYFQIPRDQWPYIVKLLDRDDPDAKYCQPNSAAEDDDGAEESWGNEDMNFLALSLPDSSLVMVDTVEAMSAVVDHFSYGATVAGMDSEWKPAFGGRQSELALVQIATHDRVYIIDVVNLAGKGQQVWNQLGNCLFRNKEVLKLGFDIGNDLQMIKSALPDLGQIKQTAHGYLDLSLLWKRLTNTHKLILPYRDASKDSSSESLSQLVFLTLGRALNKANQFSNWEQRPLRIGQLRYAALDAFCLLDVYQVLRSCCDEQNIPFLEVCDEIMLNYKGPRKSGNNASKKKPADMVPPAMPPACVAPVTDDQSMSSADDEPMQLLCRRVTRLTEDLYKIRDNAAGVWQSDLEAYLEDLERVVHQGKKCIDHEPRYCWYHERFGADSQGCQQPCDFDSSSFDPENCDWALWDSDVSEILRNLEALLDYHQEAPETLHYCWYHMQYGPESHRCQPPCDFNRSYYFEEWCEQQVQVMITLCEDMNLIAEYHSTSTWDSRNPSQSLSYDAPYSPPRETPFDSGSHNPRDRSSSSSRRMSRDRSSRNQSRDRSYSPPRHSNSRGRSQDQFRDESWTPSPNGYHPSPPSPEVMCWYHREFGESAKRCNSPCEFYDYFCAAYAN